MPMLIGLENNNIQRLEKMGGMRWETEQYNLVLLTVVQELIYAVGPVAIKQQKPMSTFLGLGTVFLKVLDPLIAELII